jgi:hypothetical protein
VTIAESRPPSPPGVPPPRTMTAAKILRARFLTESTEPPAGNSVSLVA